MIIIITNRDHNDSLPDEITSVPISFMSNQIGTVQPGRTDRNYICTVINRYDEPSNNAKDKALLFYPYKKRKQIFKGIKKPEIKRQWVIYVHGHHQDPLENIQKAIDIERVHNVNVLAFSWPSHSYITTQQQEYTLELIKQLVIKHYGLSGWVGILASKIWDGADAFIEYWQNYPHAKEKAVLSVNDLAACLHMFKNDLLPLTNSAHTPNLIVASLGNFLLENTIKQQNALAMDFKNIVLHEADANAVEHVNWVPILHNHCESLFITVNTDDSTLWASTVRNETIESGDTDRLGLIRSNYLVDGNTRYLDLSRMPCAGLITGCEFEHEFYIKDTNELIEPAVKLMGALLNGNKSFLPDTNGRSKNGFSKMPTAIELYMFEDIVMHPDRGDGGGNNGRDTETPSLDAFEDPLATPPLPDPDLDDD